jgi:hypothetical protein
MTQSGGSFSPDRESDDRTERLAALLELESWLERPAGSLPTATLWWTAMVMTTLGSEYWPKSTEGRMLGFLLAVYAFPVWGYITASLATFFVGRDADDDRAELRAWSTP